MRRKSEVSTQGTSVTVYVTKAIALNIKKNEKKES